MRTPETMKLFGNIKTLIYKTKNVENAQRPEVFEGILVQCNSADNQYPQEPKVLYTFTLNNSYPYLINVEPRYLVCLKTYNTEFDDIMDQKDSPLEIANKVN